MLRLTDLREILRYVPRFRDRVFVIAMDGAVVEDDNFGNLLLDIALLRSLRIGVGLVHGAGHQIRRLAGQTGLTPSNVDGTGAVPGAGPGPDPVHGATPAPVQPGLAAGVLVRQPFSRDPEGSA